MTRYASSARRTGSCLQVTPRLSSGPGAEPMRRVLSMPSQLSASGMSGRYTLGMAPHSLRTATRCCRHHVRMSVQAVVLTGCEGVDLLGSLADCILAGPNMAFLLKRHYMASLEAVVLNNRKRNTLYISSNNVLSWTGRMPVIDQQ